MNNVTSIRTLPREGGETPTGKESKRRTIIGDYYLRSRNIAPPPTVSGLKEVHRSRSAGSSPGAREDNSPRGRGGVSPKGREGVSPRGRGGVSPRGRGGVSPRGRGDPSPRARGGVSPRGRGDLSPRAHGGGSPRGRGGISPRGRGDLSPRGRGGVSPRGRGDLSPRGRGGLASKSGGRVKATMSVKRKAVRSASSDAPRIRKKLASDRITSIKKISAPVQNLRHRTFQSPPVVPEGKASGNGMDTGSDELILPILSTSVRSQRITTTIYSDSEPALLVNEELLKKRKRSSVGEMEDSEEDNDDDEIEVRSTLKRIRPELDGIEPSNKQSPTMTTKSTSVSILEFSRDPAGGDKHFKEINKSSISIELSESGSSKDHDGLGGRVMDEWKMSDHSLECVNNSQLTLESRGKNAASDTLTGHSSGLLLDADPLKWEMTGPRSQLIDKLWGRSGPQEKFNKSVGSSNIPQCSGDISSVPRLEVHEAPRVSNERLDHGGSVTQRRSTSRSSMVKSFASSESSCLNYVVASDGDDPAQLLASSRITRSRSRSRMGVVDEVPRMRSVAREYTPGRRGETPSTAGLRERGGGDKLDPTLSDDMTEEEERDVPGNGDIFSRIDDYPASGTDVGTNSGRGLRQRTRAACVCMVCILLSVVVVLLVGRIVLSYLYNS